MSSLSRWPKVIAPLTSEESGILDQWRRFWHTELSSKIGIFDHYSTAFIGALAERGRTFPQTLEIGPGLTGASRLLDPSRTAAVELDPFYAAELARALPACNVIAGDIQHDIPALRDGTYDRVVAMHVLEHLRDLPAGLEQIKRVMTADGVFDVVIPCEGGFLYSIGRQLTTARHFKKKFHRNFSKFIAQDHVNTAAEILPLLKRDFRAEWTMFYPSHIPSVDMNLCVGLRLRKR